MMPRKSWMEAKAREAGNSSSDDESVNSGDDVVQPDDVQDGGLAMSVAGKGDTAISQSCDHVGEVAEPSRKRKKASTSVVSKKKVKTAVVVESEGEGDDAGHGKSVAGLGSSVARSSKSSGLKVRTSPRFVVKSAVHKVNPVVKKSLKTRKPGAKRVRSAESRPPIKPTVTTSKCKCPYCEASLKGMPALYRHLFWHCADQYRWSCDTCGMTKSKDHRSEFYNPVKHTSPACNVTRETSKNNAVFNIVVSEVTLEDLCKLLQITNKTKPDALYREYTDWCGAMEEDGWLIPEGYGKGCVKTERQKYPRFAPTPLYTKDLRFWMWQRGLPDNWRPDIAPPAPEHAGQGMDQQYGDRKRPSFIPQSFRNRQIPGWDPSCPMRRRNKPSGKMAGGPVPPKDTRIVVEEQSPVLTRTVKGSPIKLLPSAAAGSSSQLRLQLDSASVAGVVHSAVVDSDMESMEEGEVREAPGMSKMVTVTAEGVKELRTIRMEALQLTPVTPVGTGTLTEDLAMSPSSGSELGTPGNKLVEKRIGSFIAGASAEELDAITSTPEINLLQESPVAVQVESGPVDSEVVTVSRKSSKGVGKRSGTAKKKDPKVVLSPMEGADSEKGNFKKPESRVKKSGGEGGKFGVVVDLGSPTPSEEPGLHSDEPVQPGAEVDLGSPAPGIEPEELVKQPKSCDSTGGRLVAGVDRGNTVSSGGLVKASVARMTKSKADEEIWMSFASDSELLQNVKSVKRSERVVGSSTKPIVISPAVGSGLRLVSPSGQTARFKECVTSASVSSPLDPFYSHVVGTPGNTFKSAGDWRTRTSCCLSGDQIKSGLTVKLEPSKVLCDKLHVPLGYSLYLKPDVMPEHSTCTDVVKMNFQSIVKNPNNITVALGDKIESEGDKMTGIEAKVVDHVFYDLPEDVRSAGGEVLRRRVNRMKLNVQEAPGVAHHYGSSCTLNPPLGISLDEPEKVSDSSEVVVEDTGSGSVPVVLTRRPSLAGSDRPDAAKPGFSQESLYGEQFGDYSYPSGKPFPKEERVKLAKRHEQFAIVKPAAHPGRDLKEEFRDQVGFLYPLSTAAAVDSLSYFAAYTRDGDQRCFIEAPIKYTEMDVFNVYTDFKPYFPRAHHHPDTEVVEPRLIPVYCQYYGPKRPDNIVWQPQCTSSKTD
jgi:hypothetical protein